MAYSETEKNIFLLSCVEDFLFQYTCFVLTSGVVLTFACGLVSKRRRVSEILEVHQD